MTTRRMTDEERKAKYLARVAKNAETKKAQMARNRAMYDACQENLRKVMEIIEERQGATRDEVAKVMDRSSNTVKQWIARLFTEQKIYIVDYIWQDGRRTRMPVYRVGNKPNAPMSKSREDGSMVRTMDEEAMAQAEVWRRHEKWLKEWRPHVDPAAAWMMNPIA